MLVVNISKKGDQSPVLKQLSIDLIGEIGARLKQELRLSEEEIFVDAPKVTRARSFVITFMKEQDINAPGREEDARCICSKGDTGTFMLDCDDCHRYYPKSLCVPRFDHY